MQYRIRKHKQWAKQASPTGRRELLLEPIGIIFYYPVIESGTILLLVPFATDPFLHFRVGLKKSSWRWLRKTCILQRA